MSQKNLNSSISCKIMPLALCNSEYLFKVLKDSVSDLVVSERTLVFVFYVIYNKATINSLGGGGKLGIK